MRKFAFISRHEPTPEQHQLAKEKGIMLEHVGDRDAFTGELLSVDYAGVVVVHPAAAIPIPRYIKEWFDVGVFENEMRAKEGEKPTSFAKALHIYEAGHFHSH